MKFKLVGFILGLTLSVATTAMAQSTPELNLDPDQNDFNERVTKQARLALQRDLNQHCIDYCYILSIEASSQEAFDPSRAQLGFESTQTEHSSQRSFKTHRIEADVLVDQRFGSANLERLQGLFAKLTEKYDLPIRINWSKVIFPESGITTRSEMEIRGDLVNKMRNQLERVIAEYCPSECRLGAVDVKLSRATIDDIGDAESTRYVFARDGKGALFVRGGSARITLNSEMESTRKERLSVLFRETVASFGEVQISLAEIPFPKAASEVQKDLDDLRRDPYGLEKVGALLKLFRENLVSKEVYKEVRTNDTQSKIQTQTETNERTSISNNNKSELQNTSSKNNNSIESLLSTRNMVLMASLAAGLLIVLALAWRLIVNGPRTKRALEEASAANWTRFAARPQNQTGGGEGDRSSSRNDQQLTAMRRRLEIEQLHDEIMEIIVTQPKVAKDVFARILREDGVESTAKYVVIFGELVVTELLADLELKNDLATLVEYLHVNMPLIEEPEQLNLLKHAKMKLTAGKMRLMANRTLEIFDFLKSLTPKQIRDLMIDEEHKIQGIILTQLSSDSRRSVFELYDPVIKTRLMRELSGKESVPREYLETIAKHLRNKMESRPEFNAENVHGTEVLMELMERASFPQQMELIKDLDSNDKNAARALRQTLISIETIAHLREGVLLDVLLGLDSGDLIVFLAGAPEHIRRAIFSKVPPDISGDWSESLQAMRSVDSTAFQRAEIQARTKIRTLAQGGLINLMEINERLYSADTKGNPMSQTVTNHRSVA